MLYGTPRLEPVDLDVLEQVDAMRDQLRHAVQQAPMKWTQDLRKALTASAIAASNTIEGYRVDAKDVADLMDGERDVEASDENKAETLAYQQAMTYIQSLHDVADFYYSKELLNSLHWMLQGHHHPIKTAGQWRKTSIRITAPGDELATDYEGPDQELVPGLMAELVAWLNGGDLDSHVLIRAAMAHLNLVKIHPWSDGNGRMSRSLQTLLIARGGVLAPRVLLDRGMAGDAGQHLGVLQSAPRGRRAGVVTRARHPALDQVQSPRLSPAGPAGAAPGRPVQRVLDAADGGGRGGWDHGAAGDRLARGGDDGPRPPLPLREGRGHQYAAGDAGHAGPDQVRAADRGGADQGPLLRG
ncbi:hypothetical protein GCM10020000_52550 [Streptomyces olivoverticillatus]